MLVLAYSRCSGREAETATQVGLARDSLDRLTNFPTAVRQKLGFALYQAQIGQKH